MKQIEVRLFEHSAQQVTSGRLPPSEYQINAEQFDDLVVRLGARTESVVEHWGMPDSVRAVEVPTVKLMAPTGPVIVKRAAVYEISKDSFTYSVSLGASTADDADAFRAFANDGLHVGASGELTLSKDGERS